MNYQKIILQYDGTDHMGFQYQNGMPTIHGDLNLCLQKILEGKVTTRAASRTDKGAHVIDHGQDFGRRSIATCKPR